MCCLGREGQQRRRWSMESFGAAVYNAWWFPGCRHSGTASRTRHRTASWWRTRAARPPAMWTLNRSRRTISTIWVRSGIFQAPSSSQRHFDRSRGRKRLLVWHEHPLAGISHPWLWRTPGGPRYILGRLPTCTTSGALGFQDGAAGWWPRFALCLEAVLGNSNNTLISTAKTTLRVRANLEWLEITRYCVLATTTAKPISSGLFPTLPENPETSAPRGRGYSPQFSMGVCRWVPGNLTLFQSKEIQFCCPVPDKMMKIDTLFQSVRRSFPEIASLSKQTGGPERGTVTVFVCSAILALKP